MATLTVSAEINLIDDISLDNANIESENLLSNISGNISSPLGAIKVLKKPFIIGINKISDGSTFSTGVDYIIFNEISKPNTDNDYGHFENAIEITFSAENLDHFSIAFDTVNNRHPNYIIVDGVKYIDDDPIFTVSNLVGDTHTIIIEDWNEVGKQCVITGIFCGIKIEINEKNLISLNRKIVSLSDFERPSYGLIAGTGNISFNDINTQVLDYAKQNLLKSNINVKINLNNLLTKNKQLIGTFYTNEWNYDGFNPQVSVSLKDKSLDLQTVYLEPYPYTFNLTAYEIMLDIQNKIPFDINYSDNALKILQNTIIQEVYLQSETAWSRLDKIGNLCLLKIYFKNDKLEVSE